jgi:signal transduction histidine kinase
MTNSRPSFRNVRAVPWVALIGALLVLLAGVLMALYEENLYQAQKLRETREQAEILAASVTAALSFGDRQAATEYLDALKVNPEIEAAGVYPRQGPLLAGFVRKDATPLPAHIATGPPLRENDLLIVTAPVVLQKTALGTVYLRANAEPVENGILRYAVLALLVLMGALVVGGLGNAQLTLQRQAQRLAQANARLLSEMSERAKAEDALRQSQKMEAIGQLSGAMAHDFNNLLMIIKGNLHLLQRKLGLPDTDRHINAANEGVTRAAALTQRILAFSRKQDLTPTALQPSELIDGMDDLVRNSLHENIEFVKSTQARGWVILDRNQMENVVLNLVINARDAMPDGGRLFLSTDDVQIAAMDMGDVPPGRYVKLTLRDTGIGMSEDVRAKALDPFFTTKPMGQGTGLGLSTSSGFISQSKGYMDIESTRGLGTTIAIFLPRSEAGDAAEGK